MDRVREAVADFESGGTTLEALEGVILESLRSGRVSPADAAAALRGAAASGAIPADSLSRLGLGNMSDASAAADAPLKRAPGAITSPSAPTMVRPLPSIPPAMRPAVSAPAPAAAAGGSGTLPMQPGATQIAPVLTTAAPVLSTPMFVRPSTGSAWVDPDPRSADGAVTVGSLLGGRYLLERVLGEGGMGVVFLASDQEVKGEHFAIKVLRPAIREYPEALDLLREEVRRTRGLGHPNIVGVYSLNSDRSNVYMIMEYLRGKTLASLIDEDFGRGMPFMRAWPLIQDMCAALAFAHDQSVIHSDIKTSNVFITTGGKAKLLDFGIARAARGRFKRSEAGGVGALTPMYASCEMLEGRSPDVRDDIYSLACVIYETLSGKHPFDGSPANEARDQLRTPPSVATLTPRQNAALADALAFTREARTASVESLLEGLAPVGGGSGSPPVRAARAAPAANRTLWYAGGGVALAAVALIAIFAWPRHPGAAPGERNDAVKAQSALSQAMVAIDAGRRKVDARVLEARSAVDRITDRLNASRNAGERDALEKQLGEARAAADAAQTVGTIADSEVFSVDKLATLREQQRIGEAALGAGRFDEATKQLTDAQGAAQNVLNAADALPSAVADQLALRALLQRAADTIAASRGDADAVLGKARLMADQAGQVMSSGDAVAARTRFAAARMEVNREVREFLDRVIAEFAVIAKKKMDENDLDVAQAAIDQAEILQKRKADFP